jgi:uncharacterized protein YjiS (DUF1127 family)
MHSSTAVTSGESRITALTMIDRLAAMIVSRCIAWIRHQRQIRRDIEALKTLDDHLLADIGLSRSQIGDIAYIGRLPGHQAGSGAQ